MAHKIGRARWLFDRMSWVPSLEELTLALSSIQQPEKDRVLKYAFFKDAVGTLAGRLLTRKFLAGASGLPWDDIIVSRDDNEKPTYLANPVIQFNLSHQGRYTVFAGESNGAKVGIDVMEMKYTGGKPLQEFFRLMYRQLTDQEWEAVKESSLECQQEKAFFRIWCLKESYIKATGTGMKVSLRSLDFKFNSKLKEVGQYVQDTEVFLDGQKQEDWRFQEVLINDDYCVCVAIHCPVAQLDLYPALPFEEISFQTLANSCRPIIPADEAGCKELLAKFKAQQNEN